MKKVASAIIGLGLLSATTYLVVVVFLKAIDYALSLNSDISVAIIAAAGTVIVSVISIIVGKIYEVKYQIKQEIRGKKIPVYEELIAFMQRVVANEELKVKPTEEELAKFFLEWQQKAMIWASDAVLADWIKWRRRIGNSTDKHLALFLYEDLILQIRRDLGHKNKNLKTGDVLSLFINDIDEHLAAAKNGK